MIPEEIQAGLNTPIDPAQAQALVEQYTPRIREAWEAAEALRNRIANGERTIAGVEAGTLQGYGPEALPAARRLLEELREELRGHNFWLTAGLGIALGNAMAKLVSEAATAEGWTPPPGSVIRIVIPGYINVAIKLEEKA